MYVRVKIQEKSYYSQVFAYYHYDYMPYYLVFDPISDKFDIVAYFSQSCDGHRQIGFMDERENDFVQNNILLCRQPGKYRVDLIIGTVQGAHNVDLQHTQKAKVSARHSHF